MKHKYYWIAQIIMFIGTTLIVRFGLQNELPNKSLYICGVMLGLTMCTMLHICIKAQDE